MIKYIGAIAITAIVVAGFFTLSTVGGKKMVAIEDSGSDWTLTFEKEGIYIIDWWGVRETRMSDGEYHSDLEGGEQIISFQIVKKGETGDPMVTREINEVGHELKLPKNTGLDFSYSVLTIRNLDLGYVETVEWEFGELRN